MVIYPEKNNAVPDHLRCRVVFQDNSEHIYKIPTVKIQDYSLKEIKEKHLILFIPYTILRLRPRIRAGLKYPLTLNELTEFVKEVILVLKEELSDGYLTEREYHNYVRLFQFAADRVLAKHSHMNGFDKNKIESILRTSEGKQDDEITQDIYGVIYSLGRDAGNEEEHRYAYALLLQLCEHVNPHVRAYSILGLSLMAGSNILEKEVILPIIINEWKENKEYRKTIQAAIDDLNYRLKWNIRLVN